MGLDCDLFKLTGFFLRVGGQFCLTFLYMISIWKFKDKVDLGANTLLLFAGDV